MGHNSPKGWPHPFWLENTLILLAFLPFDAAIAQNDARTAHRRAWRIRGLAGEFVHGAFRAYIGTMTPPIRIIKHEAIPDCGSFEVRFGDGRPSRLRPEMVDQATALEAAKAFAGAERDKLAG